MNVAEFKAWIDGFSHSFALGSETGEVYHCPTPNQWKMIQEKIDQLEGGFTVTTKPYSTSGRTWAPSTVPVPSLPDALPTTTTSHPESKWKWEIPPGATFARVRPDIDETAKEKECKEADGPLQF